MPKLTYIHAGNIPSDTQTTCMYKIMIFFQESNQQAITTITVVVIVDNTKENEVRTSYRYNHSLVPLIHSVESRTVVTV